MTKQEQCASVGKAQNTQIVQWQRHVAFKYGKCRKIVTRLSLFVLLKKHNMTEMPNTCVRLPSEPNGPKVVDWTKADLDNVFTTNASQPGWCNVDPAEAYAEKVKFKEECDCKYDCLWGRFCEVPVLCSCINQCSGHGHCRGGFCQVMFVFFYYMTLNV